MNQETYKPNGYTSVSPYLIVREAKQAISFLATVFDAVEIQCIADPTTGRIRHAEIRIDDSIIMIADQADGWPAQSAHVHVYVPDAQATYDRAIAAGAASLQPPVQKDDADLRGGFSDPWGISWWVGSKVD